MLHSAWCTTEINCSVIGNAYRWYLKLERDGGCLIFKGKSFNKCGPIIFRIFFPLVRAKEIPKAEQLAVLVYGCQTVCKSNRECNKSWVNLYINHNI